MAHRAQDFFDRGPRARLRISSSGGFTLVELLVVITIIGMLMALLLPAVNAAVEAGRGAQCKNRLRNMATAANLYQSTNGHYPSYENKVSSGGRIGSWVVEMFAELDRYDLQEPWSDDGVAPPTPYWNLLVCPSDPPEQAQGAKLSFVANSGCATVTTGDSIAGNGIFLGLDQRATQDNILDGTSMTLLFSENIQSQRSAEGWGGASGLRERTTFVWHNGAGTATQKINGNKLTAPVQQLESARPPSFHSGGVNVAFVDTHVIFLKEGTAYAVYRQLMTPYHAESDAPTSDPVLDESQFQ